METATKIRKRKKNLSSCVYVLHRTSYQEISRPRSAVMAKKCAKKCNARAENFVVLVINFLTFLLPSLKLPILSQKMRAAPARQCSEFNKASFF